MASLAAPADQQESQSILCKTEEHGDGVKQLAKSLHSDAACHAGIVEGKSRVFSTSLRKILAVRIICGAQGDSCDTEAGAEVRTN